MFHKSDLLHMRNINIRHSIVRVFVRMRTKYYRLSGIGECGALDLSFNIREVEQKWKYII